MTSIRNHIQVAGLPRDHSRAIHVEHIESMYTITAAASPPNLVMKAMDLKQVLTKDELKAVQHHLMWSAFASLGWSLWTRNEEITSLRLEHLDWEHKEARHSRNHLRVTLVNRKGWQKRAKGGSSENEARGEPMYFHKWHKLTGIGIEVANIIFIPIKTQSILMPILMSSTGLHSSPLVITAIHL